MTKKGSTATTIVSTIPKFWVNLDGLVQSSNLNSIESTITRVFCMQGALKYHYWLMDIVPASIRRISKDNREPKTWIDKLATKVRSSLHKGGSAKFPSSEFITLDFPHEYKMPPKPFQYDDTDQLISTVSDILRLWLQFPKDQDYLAQLTLLDIVTTNFPPSILFLDKIWEMYRAPFLTLFNNNWDIRRSKTKLMKALDNFEKVLLPLADTSSCLYGKLQILSDLINNWTKFSGVDSNTVEMVS